MKIELLTIHSQAYVYGFVLKFLQLGYSKSLIHLDIAGIYDEDTKWLWIRLDLFWITIIDKLWQKKNDSYPP